MLLGRPATPCAAVCVHFFWLLCNSLTAPNPTHLCRRHQLPQPCHLLSTGGCCLGHGFDLQSVPTCITRLIVGVSQSS